MMSVKVPQELFEAVEERAGSEDRPVSWVVRRALEEFLGVEVALPARKERVRRVERHVEAPRVPAAEVCPHPADRRRVMSWGTLCEACKTRVR